MDPRTIDLLTQHQPGLRDNLTSIFDNLDQLQQAQGPDAAQGLLRRTIKSIQGAHKTRLGRTMMPKTITGMADLIDWLLEKSGRAQQLNQAISAQVSTKVKIARKLGAAVMASPLGVPARSLGATMTPPPPKAGD